MKKFTKEQSEAKHLESELTMELDEPLVDDAKSEIKFVPRPPPPRDNFGSPTGRKHTRVAKASKLSSAGNIKTTQIVELSSLKHEFKILTRKLRRR